MKAIVGTTDQATSAPQDPPGDRLMQRNQIVEEFVKGEDQTKSMWSCSFQPGPLGFSPASFPDPRSFANERTYIVLNQEESGNLEDQFSTLNETIYTILYMSKPKTVPFLFAAVIFTMQLSLVLLVLFDTVDLSATENKVKIPANVDGTIHWGQGLILIFAVAFQQDFVEAVVKFHNGPHRDFIADPQTGASVVSFYGSTIAQMVTGYALLLTIFILTMQAETVVGLMLNFAALHFLSDVDDLSFRLAKMGFVDNRIEMEIHRILSYKVRDLGLGKPKFARRALFYLVVGILLVAFLVSKFHQAEGTWLCNHVYVQFGDAFNPQVAHFSGIYSPPDRFTFETRNYVDVLTEGSIQLGFCKKEQRWTFSTLEGGMDNGDPCSDIFAQSPRLITYDVTSMPSSGWVVRSAMSGNFIPFDFFFLTCVDEDENNARIDESAVVKTFTEAPCEEIQVDGRSSEFPRLGADPLASNFQLLRNDTGSIQTEYGRPIYYSDSAEPKNFIFFSGRRWFLVADENTSGNASNHDFRLQLLRRDEISWKPLYMSSPVDYGTSFFRSTPVGLNWFPAMDTGAGYGVDTEQAPPSTRLLCIACSSHSTCLNGGICDSDTKRCVCSPGYTSGVCEIHP